MCTPGGRGSLRSHMQRGAKVLQCILTGAAPAHLAATVTSLQLVLQQSFVALLRMSLLHV